MESNEKLPKRNWNPEPGEDAIDDCAIKKQKSDYPFPPLSKAEYGNTPCNDDSNIGNESDSDADYDDLDDLALPSDNDDFMDDDIDPDEDDKSVHSTATTISDSSACSNTPSLIGESLETPAIASQEATNGPKKHAWISQNPTLTDSPALKQSLFSHIPPTINFMLHNEMSAHQLHNDLRKHLKWKLSSITPAIVKRCASNSGFRLMRKNVADWTCTWGRHMKSPQFKEIKESQKINHFPGTFNIGRKDRLWKNYHKLMLKHGKSEFNFLPRTFCLPADTKLLRKVWERKGGKGRWIVKPPALARGEGIKVINKWSQIPNTRPLIVQRYVARPYLINETKFDLRLYLLVTSVNPLRLYLYDDGLVRFASNKYSNESSKVQDLFTHLTNYSINKKSATYVSNEESEEEKGHKWTLKTLWRHFDAAGIDHSVIWEKIKDLMIKTVLSAETNLVNLHNSNVASKYSCFELFGFDILLDSKLKPWLLEVNISPSLHSSSTLDLDVKSPLATEVFNMARYHIPNRLKQKEQTEIAAKMGYANITQLCFDRRLYIKELSKAERNKHELYVQQAACSEDTLPPMGMLDHLTPDDVRTLVVSEDELATSQRFTRIFPNVNSHKYFKFTEKPRYYNLLLSAWEQMYSGINREAGRVVLEQLCVNKHHLKVPATVYVKKTAAGQQAIDISGLEAPAATASATTAGKLTNTNTLNGDSSDSGHGSISCSESSLNGSQNSLISCSENSFIDSEKNCSSEPSSLEMNGNRANEEQNGNSSLKHNGSSKPKDSELLLLETAVS